MGSCIPANSIILLFSVLQNATAIHTLITRSGADLYVNLHMAFYSPHIYMQESQSQECVAACAQLNGKHSLNVCQPCPFPLCLLILNHPLSSLLDSPSSNPLAGQHTRITVLLILDCTCKSFLSCYNAKLDSAGWSGA